MDVLRFFFLLLTSPFISGLAFPCVSSSAPAHLPSCVAPVSSCLFTPSCHFVSYSLVQHCSQLFRSIFSAFLFVCLFMSAFDLFVPLDFVTSLSLNIFCLKLLALSCAFEFKPSYPPDTVQFEGEMSPGAKALVVEHLSTSHRNDSHDPVGSHYFTSPVSGQPAGAKDDNSRGFYGQMNRHVE